MRQHMMKISIVDNSTSRERAVALHQAGEIQEAAHMYESLLQAEPANPDILGLLSVAQLGLGKAKEALVNWRKSLSLEKTIPGKLRSIANFLLAMQKLDDVRAQRPKYEAPDMGFFDDLDIPDWPANTPLDKDRQPIILELARCLIRFGHKESGLRLLDSALVQLSGDPDFAIAAASLMLEADKAEKAYGLLQPLASGAQRDKGALLLARAAAAQASGRNEEAKILGLQATEAVPIFLSPKMPDQRMLIGVLSPTPEVMDRVQTPFAYHFSANISAALVARMNEEFRFVSIFPQAQSTKAALAALPQPQLIINNWVSAEDLGIPSKLEFISNYADSFGLPVINHPRKASVTTRQLNAERLAGIPDVIVPRIIRIINEPEKRDPVLRVIEEKIGFPVILRGPFAQQGRETVKIDTAAELEAYITNSRYPQLYAIEYVHNSIAAGAYRKIRAAVIGEELFMLHVHFGAQWNVHRARDRRNLTGFDAEGTAAAFAQKILSWPEEALGKQAVTALHEIRKRISLDVYGIDFDLTPDGRILFFEANASMRISLREREDLVATRMAMRRAYRRLFENPPSLSVMKPARPI